MNKSKRDKVYESFFEFMHWQYMETLKHEDYAGMQEVSSSLCIAYASVGNRVLSRKWAEEYLSHVAANDRQPFKRAVKALCAGKAG